MDPMIPCSNCAENRLGHTAQHSSPDSPGRLQPRAASQNAEARCHSPASQGTAAAPMSMLHCVAGRKGTQYGTVDEPKTPRALPTHQPQLELQAAVGRATQVHARRRVRQAGKEPQLAPSEVPTAIDLDAPTNDWILRHGLQLSPAIQPDCTAQRAAFQLRQRLAQAQPGFTLLGG